MNNIMFDSMNDNFNSNKLCINLFYIIFSLNAYHDGYLNNCTSDKYIMAPTIAVDSNITVNKGLWQFSRCSMDYFHEFIENLNRLFISVIVISSKCQRPGPQ